MEANGLSRYTWWNDNIRVPPLFLSQRNTWFLQTTIQSQQKNGSALNSLASTTGRTVPHRLAWKKNTHNDHLRLPRMQSYIICQCGFSQASISDRKSTARIFLFRSIECSLVGGRRCTSEFSILACHSKNRTHVLADDQLRERLGVPAFCFLESCFAITRNLFKTIPNLIRQKVFGRRIWDEVKLAVAEEF